MVVADVYLLCHIPFVITKFCVGYLRSDARNSSQHAQLTIQTGSYWLDMTLVRGQQLPLAGVVFSHVFLDKRRKWQACLLYLCIEKQASF